MTGRGERPAVALQFGQSASRERCAYIIEVGTDKPAAIIFECRRCQRSLLGRA